jgi:hypothetical protein
LVDDFFDFGFTVVDETELQAVQQIQEDANFKNKQLEDAELIATGIQEKLDELYNAITPLLNNLKANPEKEYILWPDRLKKVEAFEDRLQEIYWRK